MSQANISRRPIRSTIGPESNAPISTERGGAEQSDPGWRQMQLGRAGGKSNSNDSQYEPITELPSTAADNDVYVKGAQRGLFEMQAPGVANIGGFAGARACLGPFQSFIRNSGYRRGTSRAGART